MRGPAVIASLICLNVALATALVRVWWPRSSKPPATARPSGPQSPTPSRSTATGVLVPAGALAPASSRLDWSAIESADLAKLVGNLRALACPPQTVQDIVVARVTRQFAVREAELKLRPEHLKPWDTAQWSDDNRELRQHKLRSLAREKRAQLKALLGVDLPIELTPGSVLRPLERFEQAYAALPASKRDGVRQAQETFWDELDDLERRTRGYWEPEDLANYQRLRDARSRLLAEILTPAELEAFEISTSETGRRLRAELAAFDPTDEELRQIYRLRKPLDDQFEPGPMRSDSTEGSAQRAQAFEQYEQRVKSVLGAARYTEYQRSKDPQYRNFARLAQETGVAKEALVKAYDAQKATQAEAARVRADASLGPEQRQQSLKRLQDELDRTLLPLLGERAFQAWQRAPGARLHREPRNVTVPSPPPQGSVSPP